MNEQNIERTVETAGISALAAASKTPFKTALLVTLGIGLGRLILFAVGGATIIGLIKLATL